MSSGFRFSTCSCRGLLSDAQPRIMKGALLLSCTMTVALSVALSAVAGPLGIDI